MNVKYEKLLNLSKIIQKNRLTFFIIGVILGVFIVKFDFDVASYLIKYGLTFLIVTSFIMPITSKSIDAFDFDVATFEVVIKSEPKKIDKYLLLLLMLEVVLLLAFSGLFLCVLLLQYFFG